jgi:hypothetical protein
MGLDVAKSGPAHNSVPSIAIRLSPCSGSPRGLPLSGQFLELGRDMENPNMKRFLYRYLRSSRLRSRLITLDFTLPFATQAFKQGTGNPPRENAVSLLQQALATTVVRRLPLAATL